MDRSIVLYPGQKMLILIYILESLGYIYVATLPVPVYRWPLNALTCGLEVQTTKGDALYPIQTECAITNSGSVALADATNLWSDGYTEFTAAQPYIDVRIKDCVVFNSFGMTLFIRRSAATGTILHYKADTVVTGLISEIWFYFSAGKMETVLYFDGITLQGSIQQQPLNQFALFGFKFVSKSLVLFSKNSITSRSNGKGGPLSLPGTLRFGAKQGASPTDLFKGSLACVMLFDVDIGNYHASDTISTCNVPWVGVPSPLPSCVTVSAPPASSPPASPYLVWPLDDIRYGFDTLGVTTVLTQPEYRFTEGPISLPNHAVRFDGSKFTKIELENINSSLLNDRHSIGMYLYVESNNNATVLSIRNPANDVTETHLSITETSLRLTLFNTLGHVCGTLEMPDSVSVNTWFVFAAKIQFPNDIKIIINETEYQSTHTCGSPHMSINNYTISIGYSDSDMEGFRGAMRCLVLAADIEDMEIILSMACNQTFIPIVPKNTIESERHSYSKKLKDDSVPASSMTWIAEINASTLTNCGRMCLQKQYCRSYAIKKAGTCNLYDFVVFKSLVSSTGVDYYIIS